MPIIKNQAVIDRNCLRIYGCGHAEAVRLNDGQVLRKKGCAAWAYASQRQSAKARGILWSITFPEWIEIWRRSGRLLERGCGKNKYCMARIGDVGAYEVGNVLIKTNAENAIESLTHTPWSVRFDTAKSNGTIRDKKTCIRGHELTPANKTKAGACKFCDSIRHKKYYQKKKQHLDPVAMEFFQ